MMPIPIDVLLIFILVFLVILTGIYVYLLIKKIAKNKELKIKEAYIAKHLANWDRYFRAEQPLQKEMIPQNSEEILAVEEIFLAYIHHFANAHILVKIKQFANEYLFEHYRMLLKSKKWSIKINALARIFDFQLDRLLKDCKQFEREKLSHNEYFLLLAIYSKMDPAHFLHVIQTTKATFSENEYKKLFVELDSSNLQRLIEYFEMLASRPQYALLDVLRLKSAVDALPFLENNLTNEDDEIRIRTLKAINEIGVVLNWKKYVHFTQSPLWEERLMVTKLFRNAPFELVLPYLKKLLKDEAWWVRNEAANVIYQSKQGEEILQQIITSSTDSFAIDMATEYVQRQRGLMI